MSPKWNEYKENMSKHITEKCKKSKDKETKQLALKKKKTYLTEQQ